MRYLRDNDMREGTSTMTISERSRQIAEAYEIPFDPTVPTDDWTPAQRFVAGHIAAIANLETEIGGRAYWIQANLDQAMAQVSDPDGSPSSICAVDASQFNTLCAQLALARRQLRDLARMLSRTAK